MLALRAESVAPAARVIAVHGGDVEQDAEPGDEEEEVREGEVGVLLEQLKQLRAICEGLTGKVHEALRASQTATVELYGVGGNPGLSQQLFALRERSDVTLAAVRRELEATRNHSAQMLKVTLDAQERAVESLRNAILALEKSGDHARTAVDERIRDVEDAWQLEVRNSEQRMGLRLASTVNDLEKRTDEKLAKKIEADRADARLRTWAIVIACTGLTVWSVVASWIAIRGGG